MVFDGNDGGVWRFHPLPDRAAGPGTWDNLNTPGLGTIQANGVALHPTDAAGALEGSQDNGTARRDASTGDVWETVFGGDGGLVRFDPSDGAIAYKVGPQDSLGADFFQRSDDGGRTWRSVVQTIGQDGAFPFYPVFTLDPAHPNRLLTGSTRVYETKNGAETWAAISPALSGGATPVSALAYAPGDDNVLYAAFSDPWNGSQVFRTSNDGAPWEDASGGSPWGSPRRITGLAVAADDPDAVYLSVSGFGGGKVWASTDGGASWSDIHGDLPDLPVNSLALDGATTPPTLYAGTDVGVWFSADAGDHWARFGAGLPDVQVLDVQLNPRLRVLGAATYGRGIWLASLAPDAASGDVNDDGRVDLADAAAALRIAGGIQPGDAGQVARGDVSADFHLTVADGLAIARMAAR
jgi:hypothetical protein